MIAADIRDASPFEPHPALHYVRLDVRETKAGDGVVTVQDIAQLLHKSVVSIPASVIRNALFVMKQLNLTQYGEEQVDFLRYRPVLSNQKLKEEFGYIPQKTSLEVFQYYLESRQKQRA